MKAGCRAREGRCSLRRPGQAGGGCGAGDPPGPSGSGSPAPAQYAPGPRSGTLRASVSASAPEVGAEGRERRLPGPGCASCAASVLGPAG